ncbi:MAG: 3-deoxy-8-phosphooctulonate synthase [Planctomycetota bacterium]|nr:3-deoxy-8-phosphooctulonate synthase [Planctomycetota bacterium]
MRIGSLDFVPGGPLLLMAGPCVLEDDKTPFEIARQLREMTGALGMPFVFKASYDKANRTSKDAFRGPGPEEGLALLAAIRDEIGVPVMTDVHEPEHCALAVGKVDMLQIPAFLCRQTDLLVAAGNSGLAVNIKKGQFLAPWDIEHCLGKVRSTGNEQVCVTDRGYSFGYNALVSDMRAIPQMKRFGVPVVFDATHSVQQPGGAGSSTSGDRSMAPILARAAVAAGADAVFAETHPEPDKAKSDGPNMIPLGELSQLLATLQRVQAAIRED